MGLRIYAYIFAALLVSSSAWAQPAIPVIVESQPVRVDCVSGCSGAGGSSGGLTDAQLRATPLSVVGTFWPVTQPVSGSVSVTNLPATQAVSGSVSVSNFPASTTIANFPATQPVSGTIAVSNFPATQAVSGPLTDAQLRAQALAVSLSSTTISNFPTSTQVSNFPTSTQVSNFPATQATREVMNTGRTLVGLSYTAAAPTTTDTVVTALVKASGGVAAAGAQSIVPAASKTLRITSAALGIRTTTAALPWAQVAIRVSNTTTCTAASSVLAYVPAGGTAAVIGNVGQAMLTFPDGLELPAGGSLCISVSGNVTTNVITFSATGFEY